MKRILSTITDSEKVVCNKCHGTGEIWSKNHYAAEARHERKRLKLSAAQTARAMNISPSYLTSLEKGEKNWSNELIASNKKALRSLTK